jgi:hypothetical protein
MKNKLLILLSIVVTSTLFTVSCSNDIEKAEQDSDYLTSETFYQNEGAYKQFLAKLYMGLATSGQGGPSGAPDIAGIDGGFGTSRASLPQHGPRRRRVELVSWGARRTLLARAYVLARLPCSHEADWHAQEPMPIMLGARGSTLTGRRPQCLGTDVCPWTWAPPGDVGKP